MEQKLTSSLSVSIRRLDSLPPPLIYYGSNKTSGSTSSLNVKINTETSNDKGVSKGGPDTKKSVPGNSSELLSNVAEKSSTNSTQVHFKNLKRSQEPSNSSINENEIAPKKRKTCPSPAPNTGASEKSKLKQVAYPRKSSPTKHTTTLKTIKKYRTARNANLSSPEKTKPTVSSPLKRRVMPKRKPKTEIEKKKLLVEKDDDDEEEVKPTKKAKPKEKKHSANDGEEVQISRWLDFNEEYDLRPIRAAGNGKAIAATKKGRIGAGKSRSKRGIAFRLPKEKVPKGRSRRTILKRAAKPKPLRKLPNDNDIKFHKALFFDQKYYQVGDIVSIYDGSGVGPYYLQVHYLFTDKYYREGAGLRWLVPSTPNATKLPFEPKNYKPCSSEKEISKFLKDVHFVAHCPHDYYKKTAGENSYLVPEKGTIFIRVHESESIVQQETANFPDLKEIIDKEFKERVKQFEDEKNKEAGEAVTVNKQVSASAPKSLIGQKSTS